ncbi:rRNA pseudouridine synthase [Candidatus Woesebacteria bacterium]|nr:rRNA pseudouridine synthase [Candidatus Woesebacteria bacterium]
MTMKMRIHKYLAHAGVASRRHAEEMVANGEVMVNGGVAKVGQVIESDTAKVFVGGKPVEIDKVLVYYLLNKPRGVVSAVTDPDGRRTVTSLVPGGHRLYPVGRLDYDSEGLMLLTNDGDLAYKMTHPKFEINKTYHVLVKGVMNEKSIGYLEQGVTIEGKKTAAAEVSIAEAQENNTWIDITIHEGRNRQIRKMCEAVGYPVLRLIRTHLGPWELGEIAPGKYHALKPSDVVLK